MHYALILGSLEINESSLQSCTWTLFLRTSVKSTDRDLICLHYTEAEYTMFIVNSVISCFGVFHARQFNFVLLFIITVQIVTRISSSLKYKVVLHNVACLLKASRGSRC
jgi:hypothetical protein